MRIPHGRVCYEKSFLLAYPLSKLHWPECFEFCSSAFGRRHQWIELWDGSGLAANCNGATFHQRISVDNDVAEILKKLGCTILTHWKIK